MGWENVIAVQSRTYTCGFCGDKVASERGWVSDTPMNPGSPSRVAELRVCPSCQNPTLFRNQGGVQTPGVRLGTAVRHLPVDVEKLYDEARDSVASNAHTAAVLALRKLLMHVAVEKGAGEGLSFVAYVEYLDGGGYLGKGGKGWVDLIRSRGNEANHEIVLMSPDDSRRLLVLAEMLLKLVYEFPGDLPIPVEPS